MKNRIYQYPTEARKAGIEGKSYINFVIEANGKVSNVKVAKVPVTHSWTKKLFASYNVQTRNGNPVR